MFPGALALTPAVAWALLVLILAPLAWYSFVADPREYRAFKAVSEPAERLGYFRLWVLRGALLYTGGPLLILALIGQLGGVVAFPTRFFPARDALTGPGQPLADFSSRDAKDMMLAIIIAIVVSSVLLPVIQAKAAKGKAVLAGDVQALLPRNIAEGSWGAALALNAGIGEELLFRLLLPLLLCVATGNSLIAFGVSTLLFGLAHVYQGVVGVLATTLGGALFGALYLGTGQLWVAMALHALIDLRSLVIAPAVTAVLMRGKGAGSTGRSPG